MPSLRSPRNKDASEAKDPFRNRGASNKSASGGSSMMGLLKSKLSSRFGKKKNAGNEEAPKSNNADVAEVQHAVSEEAVNNHSNGPDYVDAYTGKDENKDEDETELEKKRGQNIDSAESYEEVIPFDAMKISDQNDANDEVDKGYNSMGMDGTSAGLSRDSHETIAPKDSTNAPENGYISDDEAEVEVFSQDAHSEVDNQNSGLTNDEAFGDGDDGVEADTHHLSSSSHTPRELDLTVVGISADKPDMAKVPSVAMSELADIYETNPNFKCTTEASNMLNDRPSDEVETELKSSYQVNLDHSSPMMETSTVDNVTPSNVVSSPATSLTAPKQEIVDPQERGVGEAAGDAMIVESRKRTPTPYHRQVSGRSRQPSLQSIAEIAANSDSAGDEEPSDAFDAGAVITEQLGEKIATLLGAEPWGDRQDGFDAIKRLVKEKELSQAKNGKDLLHAVLAAVQYGVEDKVTPVMYCSLDCLKSSMRAFFSVINDRYADYPPVAYQLRMLINALLGKLSDSNSRTRREVSHALIRLVRVRKLKALPIVMTSLKEKEVPVVSQAELLSSFVRELGVEGKYGLTIDMVMEFALPALSISEAKTRKATIELIATLHVLDYESSKCRIENVKPDIKRQISKRAKKLVAAYAKEMEAKRADEQQQDQDFDVEVDRGVDFLIIPTKESPEAAEALSINWSAAEEMMGPVEWRKSESKTWSDRKDALVSLESKMNDDKAKEKQDASVCQTNFTVYCTVIYKFLDDTIAPVVCTAIDVFSTLLKVYGAKVDFQQRDVQTITMLTSMKLLSIMQKSSTRMNRGALRGLLKLVRLPSRAVVQVALSCIFSHDTDLLVRMQMLKLLVPEFGFHREALSAQVVLESVALALGNTNDKVRKAAMDVALCTQRIVGKKFVLHKLDGVKPAILRELEKNFVDSDRRDDTRPQTVHASSHTTESLSNNTSDLESSEGLPPVSIGRRILHSAPVGSGSLQFDPNDDGTSARRASVLSNDEEYLMDSILNDEI